MMAGTPSNGQNSGSRYWIIWLETVQKAIKGLSHLLMLLSLIATAIKTSLQWLLKLY
jgi:hypothetical protein